MAAITVRGGRPCASCTHLVVTVCGSTERPNLYLACRNKVSEDIALMASMLADVILGKPCSLAREPSVFLPPGQVPATVIYCVSKQEVETMCSVMNADARLRGLVRASPMRILQIVLAVENSVDHCKWR